MEMVFNQKAKTILVLTEFTARDRNAADAALKLAFLTGANLMLFNAYPVLFPGFSDHFQDEDGAFLIETEKRFDKEKERLESTIIRSDYPSFSPSINSCVKEGSLCENVKGLLFNENIIMVVMGGRPERDTDRLFCGEINEILDKVNRPVLVIPENQPLEI